MSRIKRILAGLLRIAAGVPIVALTLSGLLLLTLGATWRGRAVGASFAVAGIVLFCSVGYQRRDWFRRVRRRFYATLVPFGLLLYIVPMLLAPDGHPANDRIQNRYLHNQGRFHRFAPANVVPEADQIKIGTTLLSLGMVPRTESARMRSLILPMLDEIDRDPDFGRLGSAMGSVYLDLARLEFRSGHYFLFIPKTADGERIPCLIFLHGMGGNLKSCFWILSKISERTKCAIVAPTFGNGDWDKPGGAELAIDVAREVIDTLPIDPQRVYLMGYSNGALGVTRAAILAPSLFAGLIYLSPVTEDELFSDKAFLSRHNDRELLFLHGRDDRRIPLNFVEGTVSRIKGLGRDVRLEVFDDDHYLLFSQPEKVLDAVIELMTAPIGNAARNPDSALER